jgi:predicted DNA-binding protein
VKENEALKKRQAPLARLCLLHVDAERLDELAVLNTRRASRFARPAIEAEIEVMANLRREIDAAIRQGSHEIDPAARTVHLGAQFDIRRARRKAKSAMNAVEEEFVIDAGVGA